MDMQNYKVEKRALIKIDHININRFILNHTKNLAYIVKTVSCPAWTCKITEITKFIKKKKALIDNIILSYNTCSSGFNINIYLHISAPSHNFDYNVP